MTTTPHAVTTQPTPARTKGRLSVAKPLTAALLAAGLLVGGAGAATANTGASTSTSSIPRSLTVRIDPNLVHPDAHLIPRRTPRLDPGVMKTDCFVDVGAAIYRCP